MDDYEIEEYAKEYEGLPEFEKIRNFRKDTLRENLHYIRTEKEQDAKNSEEELMKIFARKRNRLGSIFN